MNKEQPIFSIIILFWNNHQTIATCLDALSAQTIQDFEIIIVDNGSNEPLSKALLSKYPNLSVECYTLEKNIGFAGGNNFAASHARANHLVLLNADAFPNPDWLENIQRGILNHPDCFFASKLIMADRRERMDGMGDVYHISGLVWRRAHNSLISAVHNQEREVFSPCGAASVYPTGAFKKVNGFDEDYFSYSEDIDLGFRLRLLGYQCIYLPDAVVYHVGSGSTSRRSDLSVYYGQRNLVWTFLKDMPGVFVWILAPFHLLANLVMVLIGIFRKQGGVTIRAKWDALLNLRGILGKRRQVQSTRSIPISQLLRILDWNPISPISKLIHS